MAAATPQASSSGLDKAVEAVLEVKTELMPDDAVKVAGAFHYFPAAVPERCDLNAAEAL